MECYVSYVNGKLDEYDAYQSKSDRILSEWSSCIQL